MPASDPCSKCQGARQLLAEVHLEDVVMMASELEEAAYQVFETQFKQVFPQVFISVDEAMLAALRALVMAVQVRQPG